MFFFIQSSVLQQIWIGVLNPQGILNFSLMAFADGFGPKIICNDLLWSQQLNLCVLSLIHDIIMQTDARLSCRFVWRVSSLTASVPFSFRLTKTQHSPSHLHKPCVAQSFTSPEGAQPFPEATLSQTFTLKFHRTCEKGSDLHPLTVRV